MRLLSRFATGCLLALVAATSMAQTGFPSKRVTIVVPYSAGGPTDVLTRAVAEKMQAAFGQPVVVENVAGASGTIGMARIAKEPADGHTIFIGGGSNFIASLMMQDTYNPLKELQPVAGLAQIPLLLQIHPSVPATNVAEFIAYARANPGKLSAYTTGVGSLNQVAAELFNAVARTDIVTVPYKGGAQAIPDLISGRVQVTFDAIGLAREHEAAGRLRFLAVTSKQRVPMVPQLPTLAEAGLRDFEVVSWLGVFVRTGTDRAILSALTDAFRAALAAPDVQQRFTATGYLVNFENDAGMGVRLANDVAKWRTIIKEIDMRLR